MPLDGSTYETRFADVVESLRRVRSLVAKPDGWHQAQATADGRVCLMQAVDRVFELCETNLPGSSGSQREIASLFAQLPAEWQAPGYKRISLIDWNDALGRTQAEVVALIDRAIAAS